MVTITSTITNAASRTNDCQWENYLTLICKSFSKPSESDKHVHGPNKLFQLKQLKLSHMITKRLLDNVIRLKWYNE
jgi:hypothetical protein